MTADGPRIGGDRPRRLRLLLRTGSVAGLGVAVVWWLGAGPVLHAFELARPGTVLAAVAIGAVSTAASAWRWSRIARGLGLRLSLSRAVAEYYRALFLNGVLPGGVLGDVHRAVRHGRDVGDARDTARAVVLERAGGQVVLIAAVGLVVVLEPASTGWWRLPGGVLVAAAAAAGALAVAVLVFRRHIRRSVRPLDLALTLGASAVALAAHVGTFVLAARATGSAAPLTRLVPIMLVALLAMSLPVNVGGWGAREGATAWLFAGAGWGAQQGLTVAVLYGVLALTASLPGGLVLTWQCLGRLAPRSPVTPRSPVAPRSPVTPRSPVAPRSPAQAT